MIDTPRLRLVPFAPAHLLALMEGYEPFAQCVGFQAADGLRELFTSGDVSPAWLEALRGATAPDPWIHGFAVVHRENASIIGSVGFKGPPDDAGAVEIAYGIAPSFQSRGYATEAATAAIKFALASGEVRRLIAHTLPTDNASTRVLKKCKLEFVGEVNDPDDGLVWRWELAPATAR